MTEHPTAEPLAIRWPDAELERLTADYDTVDLLLTESSGRALKVCARGFTSLSWHGVWDEVVVESARFESEGPLIDAANRRRASAVDSGSPWRNRGQFRMLIVRFIDGAELQLVASTFDVSQVESPTL